MNHALTALLVAALLATATYSTFAQEVDTKPATADSQPASAFAALEGVWVYEKATSAGQEVPKEKLTHEFHFKSPDQLIRKGITVGKVTGRNRSDQITLDSSKKPAHMDITRTVHGKTETVYAIYKIDRDLLTICFLRGAGSQPSSERPTDFESGKATKSDLLVLKRKAQAIE